MDDIESWIGDYTEQRTCRAARATTDHRLILQFVADFCRSSRPQTLEELFARTDFLQEWARIRDWRGRSDYTSRSELIAVRVFSEWLFATGRTKDNVYLYVRPKFEAVINGDIPRLWLRHNLQQDIARFDQTLTQCDKATRITLLQAAHSWNVHLNSEQTDRTLPIVDEELVLTWLGKAIRESPTPRRAADLLRGLISFLGYLMDRGLLDSNPAEELLARDSYRSPLRIIHLAATAETISAHDIGRELARLERFQSHLAPEFEACLRYLAAQKMKTAKAPYAFKEFDRILLRNGVQRPSEITAEHLNAFLHRGQVAVSTRNQRLVWIRRFFKFLDRRGEKLSFSWQRWRRQPVPDFRPHIYSLKEVASLLDCVRQAKATDPIVPYSVELVLFLCYACGMRLGEPVSLRVRDVQLDQGLIFIERTKFYKQRWAPYGKVADRRLREYWQRRSQLFPERGHPDEPFFLGSSVKALTKSTVGRLFREAVDQKLALLSRGTHRPRIHDLRHSFAVHRLHKWYSDGADVQNKLPLLTAYMGHAHIRHTEVYLHLAEDFLRGAGRGFERAFRTVLDSGHPS